MLQTARLVLTGYDLSKIDRAVSVVLKNMSRFNISIQEKPSVQKIGHLDDEPKLWGCDSKDVTRKAMTVKGSFTDMKNLVHVKTPDGVLVELVSCN